MDVNNTTQDNSTFTLPPPIPLDYNNYTNILSGSNNYTNSTFTLPLDYNNYTNGTFTLPPPIPLDYNNYTNILSGSNNYTNSTFHYFHNDTKAEFIIYVVTYIITSIGLPLTLVDIYSLYSLVRNDHVAPIYVINLLISDLIQLCCMICFVAHPESPESPESLMVNIINNIYYYSLMTSVGFMVCITLERYLLIVFPLWYHCRRTIKSTVVICVVVWAIPSLYLFTGFADNSDIPDIIALVFLFLPFPLLTFFCCATLRALSASVSILPEKKRRIVGTFVLVLLNYTLLFLPYAIWMMVDEGYIKDKSLINTLLYLSDVFLTLNPLADLILYIFMKKGALDKILASVCCCRVVDQDVSSLENNTNAVN